MNRETLADLLEEAMDALHDVNVTFRQYAEAAADKVLEMAGPSLQSRVEPWMDACFGPEISGDKLERGDRLLEEVLELLQSGDYPKDRISILADYTFARPKGDPDQEVGGVMITLAAYCLAHSLDMHECGENELSSIWEKVEVIREKQLTKPKNSPLPQSASATIRQVAVTVKPLDMPERRNGYWGHKRGYQVAHTNDDLFRVRLNGKVICKDIRGFARAVSWANSHNEKTILSAITARPEQVVRDEESEAYAKAAESLGYHCIGCGHLCSDPEKDLVLIRKAGGLSCCPEREMEPLSAAIRAMKGGQC